MTANTFYSSFKNASQKVIKEHVYMWHCYLFKKFVKKKEECRFDALVKSKNDHNLAMHYIDSGGN